VSDSIDITCADGYYGYYASGDLGSVAVCQADEVFSVPECLKSCPVVPVRHPGYVIRSGATNIGSTRSSDCATGFTGNATSITCLEDSTWSSPSGCVPIISDCSGQFVTATDVQPDTIDDCDGTCTSTGHGKVCRCSSGFKGSTVSPPCEPDQ